MENFGLPPEVGCRFGASGFKPDRPTLVMIHGAGGNSLSFLPQIRQLDRQVNILALDLPGHGETPGSGLASISDYANWVFEILKVSEIQDYFLMGHSMGGAICLEMALGFPRGIQGLILLSTAAYFPASSETAADFGRDPQETLARINRQAYNKETPDTVISQSLKIFMQTPMAVIQGDFQACSRFDFREEIKKLQCPTLIMVGDQDISTPPEFSEYLKSRIPESNLLILPGAAHMITLEKPKEVNQAVGDFILKNTGSGQG
jgi:pimeloyl-ACP methyl ester carboxylesterase